ncbi:MAG: (Fe-S)-binding protein, partial [Corynebacterium sp.]|uniref:(Fe-S)-binding protein n=1 Tax=Corynebacterium sp. TaxID=1720 RepID=UPI0026DF820F
DPARRAGNEFLFQMLATENIATLNDVFDGVPAGQRKIITTCPHCFNTIRNEYPDFDGHFDVFHHTQLLNRLVREKLLTPVPRGPENRRPVTYHDPCFLGRHNQVYDPPRELVAAAGAELREMDLSRDEAFCCGAGGARMYMEETIGRRVNEFRSEQALATGAEEIATGCPFCNTMFTGGVKALIDAPDRPAVRDVAQMLRDSVLIDGHLPAPREPHFLGEVIRPKRRPVETPAATPPDTPPAAPKPVPTPPAEPPVPTPPVEPKPAPATPAAPPAPGAVTPAAPGAAVPPAPGAAAPTVPPAPGVAVPSAPGAAVPPAPGAAAPAVPPAPGVSVPSVPGSAVPPAPGAAAPAVPPAAGVSVPPAPGAAAPAVPPAPGAAAPAVPPAPGVAVPTAQGSAVPPAPGAAAPAVPPASGAPTPAAPTAPGAAIPSAPGTAIPPALGAATPAVPPAPGTAVPPPGSARPSVPEADDKD